MSGRIPINTASIRNLRALGISWREVGRHLALSTGKKTVYHAKSVSAAYHRAERARKVFR